jgi:rhodanese-related sulfurtransferase
LTVEEAKVFYDRNEALFIDAREESEYESEHIPYALNVPYRVNRRTKMEILSSIPRNKNLIIYCSDSLCTAAERVAGELRFGGYSSIAIMKAGIIGWLEAEFPVEAVWMSEY